MKEKQILKSKESLIDPDSFKRIVIKIGSNVLASESGIQKSFFNELASQVYLLKQKNIQPIIVSSGAIAAAMTHLGKSQRPKTIPEKQAYAAIGQPILMNYYSHEFSKKNLQVAQVLLTQDGLDHRERFINAKHALNTLIKNNVIPIINENDTVSVDEIKIGDNDQLSAHVAQLVDADLLIILSHVKGLFDGNPDRNKNHNLIPVVTKIDAKIKSYVFQDNNQRSTGGMHTKLLAAGYCMSYGISVLITSGFQKGMIQKIFENKIEGTWFVPQKKQVSARKHWINNVRKAKGQLMVDSGAEKALIENKKSLLPSGIILISGQFEVGDCIEIINRKNEVLGKGLSSYSSSEIKKIMGIKTTQIEKVLGYKNSDEVVHRDDLVITANEK